MTLTPRQRRTTSRTTTGLALLATIALLSGCAGEAAEPGAGTEPEPTSTAEVTPPDEDGDDDATGPAEDAVGDLTIEVDTTGSGDVTRWTLTCDPPGGDHPDPEGACAAIEAAGGAGAFTAPPTDQMCTQIYGGPQTAEVTGTFDGATVAAQFSRENGCEIGRWDALEALLGETDGAGGTVTE